VEEKGNHDNLRHSERHISLGLGNPGSSVEVEVDLKDSFFFVNF